MSTVLTLPDDRRAAVERELVPLARAAALGRVAADVAHDLANPLFGMLGLADLLLEEGEQTSDSGTLLRLIRQSAVEMRDTLALLLAFARLPPGQTQEAALDEAARLAVAVFRHGARRTLEVDERYPDRPTRVPCPPLELRQAVLHLLLAAGEAERLSVEVSERTLRVEPGAPESLELIVAARIAADHGGVLERSDDALVLRFIG